MRRRWGTQESRCRGRKSKGRRIKVNSRDRVQLLENPSPIRPDRLFRIRERVSCRASSSGFVYALKTKARTLRGKERPVPRRRRGRAGGEKREKEALENWLKTKLEFDWRGRQANRSGRSTVDGRKEACPIKGAIGRKTAQGFDKDSKKKKRVRADTGAKASAIRAGCLPAETRTGVFRSKKRGEEEVPGFNTEGKKPKRCGLTRLKEALLREAKWPKLPKGRLQEASREE